MTYAFEFIFLIHQRLSAVQIMQLRNSYFHFPYELFFPPSQFAPFKFSVKRRKLKTDADRFADKKRLASVLSLGVLQKRRLCRWSVYFFRFVPIRLK